MKTTKLKTRKNMLNSIFSILGRICSAHTNMSKYDFLPINIEHAIQNIHKFSRTQINSFEVVFHPIFSAEELAK